MSRTQRLRQARLAFVLLATVALFLADLAPSGAVSDEPSQKLLYLIRSATPEDAQIAIIDLADDTSLRTPLDGSGLRASLALR